MKKVKLIRLVLKYVNGLLLDILNPKLITDIAIFKNEIVMHYRNGRHETFMKVGPEWYVLPEFKKCEDQQKFTCNLFYSRYTGEPLFFDETF